MPVAPAKHGWLVVGASTIALIVSVNALFLTPYGVMVNAIAADFGWTRAQVSNGLSIFALTAAITMPFAGRLLDSIGIKKVGIPGVVLTAACLVALAFCPPNMALWYGTLAALGVVSVGQGGLIYMKVAAEWIDRRRGLAVGIVGTGLAVGNAVAPPLTQALLTGLGTWRTVFLVMAVALLVLALPPLVFVIREPRLEERESGPARHVTAAMPGLELGEAVRTRQFWILLLTTLTIGTAGPGALVHMVPNLTDQGLAPERAVLVVSMSGLMAMIGRLIGGWLLDRFHAPHVAFVVFLAPVLGFVFLSGQFAIFAISLVGGLLIGAAMGGKSDLVGYMTSRYMGMKRFGQIYGIFYALLALGYALGPFVFALSFDRTGSYNTAFFVAGILLVVCAFGGLTLGRYRYPAGIAIPVADDPDDDSELVPEQVLVDNPVLPRHKA